MTHNLKIYPEFFEAIIMGAKPFEVRFNDRNYQLGDILVLQEFTDGRLTGRKVYKQVCFLLDDPAYCKEGFVILGLTEVEQCSKCICPYTPEVAAQCKMTSKECYYFTKEREHDKKE